MNRLFPTIAGFMIALALVITTSGTAGATAFDLSVDSGNQLTISGTSLTGGLSITGNGLQSGDVLVFSASLTNPVTTTNPPNTNPVQSGGSVTTTYTMAGSFTLTDTLGTLTGTFTSASLSNTVTYATWYSLTGGFVSVINGTTTALTGLEVTTSNAYYNGIVSTALDAIFGLPAGSTAFTGGTLTFEQNTEVGSATTVSGSLTSGTAPSAVPVPPSLLLFAPALFGLAGIRRRFAK